MSKLDNEIIDAEYTEANIVAGVRSIEIIETEIITITRQAQVTAMHFICELGKRLTEAKELVEHGNWGQWLEERVNYSQSTAENYMKIFKEYKGNQYSLFGDLSESQTLLNLDATKLLLLTKIPADERERFADDNDAENISVRELKQRIKDLEDIKGKIEKEAKENKELLENRILDLELEQGAIDTISDLEKAKDAALDKANKKQKEIDSLKAQIEELSSQAIEPSDNELEQIKADAEAEIKAEYEDKLKEAEQEKEELEEKLKSLEEDIDTKIETAKAKAKEELEAELKIHKADKEAATDKIIELEKKLKGSNGDMAKLNIYFSEFQLDFEKVQECLKAIKDNENFEKIKTGMVGQLSSMAEMLSEV